MLGSIKEIYLTEVIASDKYAVNFLEFEGNSGNVKTGTLFQ